MIKNIILEPSSSSFHFFIYTDEKNVTRAMSKALYYEEICTNGAYLEKNLIVIGTKSDFLKVLISFELLENEPIVSDGTVYVNTVYSDIRIINGYIKLFDPPDGEFAKLKVPNGMFNLKVCFKEDDKVKEDFSFDSYLIQMWPKFNEKS